MTHRFETTAVVVLLALLLAGCTYREGTLAAVSVKTLEVPLSTGERVKGEDCLWLAWIFPVNGRYLVRYDKAIEKAIESSQADFLTDVTMYRTLFHFIIGSHYCAVVEGTVAKVRKIETDNRAVPTN